MKLHSIIGIAAIGSMAAVASADVNLTFDNFIASGGQFAAYDDEVVGVLDTVDGDFLLNAAGENFTWADDLTLLVAEATESGGVGDILIQVGGYSDYGAANRFTWPTGASGDAGTVGGGEVAIGGIDVTGYRLWIGNGYTSGGAGNWSGDIFLGGSIAFVPAPGALALLGLGGLAARRRRG
jgi:hypothetical protein